MNAIMFIVTSFVLLVGSGLTALASIWKKKETLLRVLGFAFTVAGGVLAIVIGIRSTEKTDALLRNTKEASFYASGGDTYPVVFAHATTREDGRRQIQFNFQKEGKYPLYSVQVYIGIPYRTSQSDTTIYYRGNLFRQFPELDENASYLIGFEPVPEEQSTIYSIYISARNGQWEEVINMQNVGAAHTFRWTLFGSDDPMISPSKQILDLADNDFPPGERKRKLHPLTQVALPIAPLP